MDKNQFKGFSKLDYSSRVTEAGKLKRFSAKQEKLMAQFESRIPKNSKWGDSFVCEKNFDKNKELSSCGSEEKKLKFSKTSPTVSSLIGNFMSYKCSQDIFSKYILFTNLN